MKEQVREEIEKFQEILTGTKEQLCTLLLTDVIASLVNVYKNENNEVVKDYTEFDNMAQKIKDMLEDITIPVSLNLINSAKQSIEHIEKISTECNYALRTLTWVNELEEDKDKEVEKDA